MCHPTGVFWVWVQLRRTCSTLTLTGNDSFGDAHACASSATTARALQCLHHCLQCSGACAWLLSALTSSELQAQRPGKRLVTPSTLSIVHSNMQRMYHKTQTCNACIIKLCRSILKLSTRPSSRRMLQHMQIKPYTHLQRKASLGSSILLLCLALTPGNLHKHCKEKN